MSDPSDRQASSSFRRPPWTSFKQALARAGFRPSRRLGQNFLLDENMCRALARDAELRAGEFVLEVGAGCGFLTAHLAETGARVLAVEVDGRLVEIAQDLVGGHPGVRLLHADALAGKHRLAPELQRLLPSEGRWSLVANLPYVISAPLIAVVSELPHPPDRMHVLVQREVAERIAAPVGSSARGPISVKLQSAYRASVGRVLSPALFWPRPKVDSAVAVLERRPDAPPAAALRALDELTRELFQHRRQGVGRVLGSGIGDRQRAREILAEIGIDPLRRPVSLTLEELMSISNTQEWAERQDPTPDS